jgi:hypothetical protein
MSEKLPIPKRAGYKFVGWKFKAGGKTYMYTKSGGKASRGNTKLVKFNKNKRATWFCNYLATGKMSNSFQAVWKKR